MRNERYAENEITLASALLEQKPNDQKQKDRLAFWLAFLERWDEADLISTSEKMTAIINERRNSIPV